MGEMIREKHQQEISKSRVRVRITYLMGGSYAFASIGLIGWLMFSGSTELALGVFSGLASTSATIIAFWFGSRGPAKPSTDDRQGEG